MKNQNFATPLVALIVVLTCLVTACTNSGGGSDSSGTPNPGSSSSSSGAVTTRCGAVSNGVYKNPITSSDGQPVSFVSAAGPNLVVIELATGGQVLVRLQGLSASIGSVPGSAEAQINSFSRNGLFYVPAGAECSETLSNGAIAQIGSLFNSLGEGLGEALAASGAVKANTSDICGGAQIGVCLQALNESPPETATAGELSRLLWKPQADSDGKLAVQTAAFGTTVVVNGETGTNQGPGNGYGSLARFNRPGCAYGAARVQVFNRGGLPYTVAGKTTFTIPNGCGRFCIENGSGQVVSCSK